MFSVLLSCYSQDNPEELELSLKSIFNQSSKPSQIVIVKDGLLTEELDKVIDDFLKNSKLIEIEIVKIKENIGLGPALLKGVSKCNQPYIIRQDSDDISRKDRLYNLEKFIYENESYDVIGTHISEFNEEPNDLNCLRKVPLDQKSIKKYSYLRNPINHVSVCIKKDFFKKFRYKSVPFHEDYFLWIEALNNGARFINLDFVSVDVRVGRQMTSRRRGINYLKHEIYFLYLCYKSKYFSLANCLIYLILRLPFRIFPLILVQFFYLNFLRKKKKK